MVSLRDTLANLGLRYEIDLVKHIVCIVTVACGYGTWTYEIDHSSACGAVCTVATFVFWYIVCHCVAHVLFTPQRHALSIPDHMGSPGDLLPTLEL